jgi:hypothetical protein
MQITSSKKNTLQTLAEGQFGELKEAEIRLLSACTTDETAWCGPTKFDDASNDPANAFRAGSVWGPEREIRAKLIQWVALDRDASQEVAPRGIHIHAALITGSLSVEFASLRFPVSFARCRILEELTLRGVHVPWLNLSGTWLKSVHADGIVVADDVRMGGGFHSQEKVLLNEAQIGGDMDCQGGNFTGVASEGTPPSVVLALAGAYVKGRVRMDGTMEKFQAVGIVDLSGARIGGGIYCEGAEFVIPSTSRARFSTALRLDAVRVDGGGIYLNKTQIQGSVSLNGAKVSGNFSCAEAKINNPRTAQLGDTGRALLASNSEIQGDIVLTGLVAQGLIRFHGTQVTGDLLCSEAVLSNIALPKDNDSDGPGVAFDAERIATRGHIFLGPRLQAKGAVKLYAAQIGGNLEFRAGSSFSNPQTVGVVNAGHALDLQSASIKNDLFLNNCDVEGACWLPHLQIGGSLFCDHTTFTKPTSWKQPGQTTTDLSVNMEGSGIAEYVLFQDGCCVDGQITLHYATVGGQLEFSDSAFKGVDLRASTINGGLLWTGIKHPERASLDLRDAQAGFLRDDPKSWPTTGNLYLEGFVYRRFSREQNQDRLEWLSRDSYFSLQSYRRLGQVLDDMGNEDAARAVAFELERRKREIARRRIVHFPVRWLRSTWDTTEQSTIGYGVHPDWAGWWLAGFAVLGWLLFWRAGRAGAMVPTDKEAYEKFRANGTPPGYYPPFNPLIYSIENTLPLVKLGQDDKWQPDVNASTGMRYAKTLRWVRWVLIGLGWLLATFLVAGLTGIIKTS